MMPVEAFHLLGDFLVALKADGRQRDDQNRRIP
jgi:hypothetical protein